MDAAAGGSAGLHDEGGDYRYVMGTDAVVGELGTDGAWRGLRAGGGRISELAQRGRSRRLVLY